MNDNTVYTNLFEDVRLLQTGLSLNDTLFDVVQGLPHKYANSTTNSTYQIFLCI